MQSDPNKQDYNNYGNNFVNQPPMGTGNAYPNMPPAYSQYPQQQPASQTPVYQQQGVVVVPVYRRPWNNLILTPMTSNLKTYFAISGILYLIYGILSIGLEVGIIVNSYYSTYYRGVWVGGFLIGGGISLLIASCRASYVMTYLIRMLAIGFVFIILGLILSIVNITTSHSCHTYYWYSCDNQLAVNLKIGILVLFIVATIHNIVNIIVANNAQKRTILAAT